jgi:hypothetical protein
MALPVTFDTLIAVCEKLMTGTSPIIEWSEPEQTFWHAWQFVLETNNGGLLQFYQNQTGDYAVETVTALNEIRAAEIAAFLSESLSRFPGEAVPKNHVERRELLDGIDQSYWRTLDEQLNKLNDGDKIDELLIRYTEASLGAITLPFFLADAINRGSEEFRQKDYAAVVDTLAPFEGHLQGSAFTKLSFARKKTET